MFSHRAAAHLHSRNVHYGWLVAGVTFLAMLTMAAALGLPGAMLQPLSQEFGWTTQQVSSTLAVRFALYGLLGPFAAVLIDRWGLRKVLIISVSLVCAAMVLVTMVNQLWQLFVLWSLMLGIGSGMTAAVFGAVVANRWFVSRRGLVVGILTASASTGQLAFLPLAAWMIEQWGWRAGVLPIVAACLVVAVLVLGFMRNWPHDMGLKALGETAPGQAAKPGAAPMNFMTPFRTLAEASKSSTFWILAGTFYVCGLSTNGLLQTHFISLCGDYGLTPVLAASTLAAMGAFDLVGTIASGWLSDRYDNRKLLFWYYGLRGLSLIWLPHSGFTLVGLGLFAMFYGLDWIATVPPTVKLAGATFGPQKAGLVFGWIFAAHQLGAATAAWGGGLSRTVLMSYTPALYVAGGACIVAALMALSVRRVAKKPAMAAA
jgi:predicted MFS family arabinose efflux permease